MKAPALLQNVAAISQLLLDQVATTVFDPTTQRIHVTGDHAFVPPGQDDYRGPCPGLNALANHNFIPHNGVATIDQLISASEEVFGLGNDMASLKAIYGTAISASGDLIHMSIGQAPSPAIAPLDLNVPETVVPGGLDFTHNSFESDASPTREDKYQSANGDASNMSLPLFIELYNRQSGIPDDQVNYSLSTLADHRAQRVQDSIMQDPLFFLSPFDGLLLTGFTYNIIFTLMANRSAEHAEGRLDRDTLMSFFGVTRDVYSSAFNYNRGWERIPDIWYRRPIDDPYTIEKSNVDLLGAIQKHPDLLNKYAIGGNTNGVNTHRSVSIKELTNGTYTLQNLPDGNNLSCLALIGGSLLCPEWLKGYYVHYNTTVMNLIRELPPLFASLNCPTLSSMDPRFFSDMFAGFNASLPYIH
ncbi:Cloroperoxidase [Glonium stellatum]|uniref:Cloroperoxidase n=1 Tax=Glonium stellatum TaxID=574774 RepID=A0A8E2F0Y4_9PEZI|nr:Cloroperoxidase [Glonium stellatum]